MKIEEIIDLAEKANLFTCIAYGQDAKSFDSISIDTDGNLSANYSGYSRGEWTEHFEFAMDDLKGSRSEIIERANLLARSIADKKAKMEADRAAEKARKQEEIDRAKYEELKSKFETTTIDKRFN